VALPPAVELAASTNELVATTFEVVPEITPLAEPRLRPEGNEPEVTEYETVPELVVATTVAALAYVVLVKRLPKLPAAVVQVTVGTP
jgi:hypothetical protein